MTAMRYLAVASDFDGTLAQDGHVEQEVLDIVRQVRASGRRFLLVTGRELPELRATFPEVKECDVVVAENGALLYWPDTGEEVALGKPPNEQFMTEVVRRGVESYSVGRVIFATWRPQEVVIEQIIDELDLDYEVIFNKRAVMVLPRGVNKLTGLDAALRLLDIPPKKVIGLGDAENDLLFLKHCGYSVAVANALPHVKSACTHVTEADHGQGAMEVLSRLLADESQLA